MLAVWLAVWGGLGIAFLAARLVPLGRLVALAFLRFFSLFEWLAAGVAHLHPLGKPAEVAGEVRGLRGEGVLPIEELRLARACFGRPLDVTLFRDQLRDPRQELLHLLLRVGEVTVGIPRLEEREQLAELLDRRGLRRARLEELSLLEQLHDRVEPSAHLLIAGLLEHTPQHRGPARVARREEIGEAEKRLLEFAVLGEELLLAAREDRRILPGAWRRRAARGPTGLFLGKRRQGQEPAEDEQVSSDQRQPSG